MHTHTATLSVSQMLSIILQISYVTLIWLPMRLPIYTLQRRKHAAIEYDNKLLLERLATIVQSKTIDNQIQQSTASHASFKIEMLKTKKRLEIQRITAENQRMLRRIQEVPPAYNHVEWEEHTRVNDRNIRSMALYPEYYDQIDNALGKSSSSYKGSPARGFTSPGRGPRGERGESRAGGGGGDFAVLPRQNQSPSTDNTPNHSAGGYGRADGSVNHGNSGSHGNSGNYGNNGGSGGGNHGQLLDMGISSGKEKGNDRFHLPAI